MQDFSCARKKVLEIVEDCGLHDEREDLFQWVDQFEAQSKEGLEEKERREPGNLGKRGAKLGEDMMAKQSQKKSIERFWLE